MNAVFSKKLSYVLWLIFCVLLGVSHFSKGEPAERTHVTNATYTRSFQQDGIGNRTQKVAGTTTTTYTNDILNQYTQIAGVNTDNPTHDDDGNTTTTELPIDVASSGTQTSTYAWDAEDRLIKVTKSNGTIIEYAYDYQSRLIEKIVASRSETTTWIYDGWNPIAEYKNDVINITNTWGLDISGTGQGAGGVGGLLAVEIHNESAVLDGVYNPYYDGNGNINGYLSLKAPPHRLALSFNYEPYGSDSGFNEYITGVNTKLRHRFSTKQIDLDTGLYYYGYRWYDASKGR